MRLPETELTLNFSIVMPSALMLLVVISTATSSSSIVSGSPMRRYLTGSSSRRAEYFISSVPFSTRQHSAVPSSSGFSHVSEIFISSPLTGTISTMPAIHARFSELTPSAATLYVLSAGTSFQLRSPT